MNADTKRHIDSARQVLVGVVPNPASQIDQITNALIYKFMDDMDQAAIKAGGEPSFFVGSLKDYAWTRLMDSKVGNQQRMNLYSEALVKFSEAKQLPELFRGIFKSAYLPYRSPEVLDLFLKEINYFDYSHSEELGNAYEYLLSIMSSQGDAGQFRTPRHIIDFIVEVVNPTKDDKVLDPACGTAGFLISAYKHILSQHDGKNSDGTKNNEKPLTPDQRKALVSNFEGYDIDPGMVRISQVNMYLHQFKNPKIYQYDSLSSDERWGDKFDVILANPPFMSPKGGIKPHSKFSIQSNRSEVLFVDYIMNHLRPKGRAGIIVPEGIIFQSGKSHTQLRKKLVEDGLCAVVSLPSGVFNPYSGVKTSILFFDNELAKQKKEILFIKIGNDGFDLGAQRRFNGKSDLPEAVEILSKWRSDKKVESVLASYVEKVKIAENGDYNLSSDRYRIAKDFTNTKWPMAAIEDICDLGRGRVISKRDMTDNPGPFPVFSSQTTDNGIFGYLGSYDFDGEYVTWTTDGANAGTVFYRNGKFNCTNVCGTLKAKSDNVNMHFLAKALNAVAFKYVIQVGNPKLMNNVMAKIKIPLPPIEVQKQIVEELEGYQKIISGAKQVVENWKPIIDIDPKWEKVKLGSVSNRVTKGTTPTTNGFNFQKSGINFIKIESIDDSGYFIKEKFAYIDKTCNESLKRSQLKSGDVLFSIAGALGRVAQVQDSILPANTNQALAIISPTKELESSYLEQVLRSDLIQGQIKGLQVGVAQSNLSLAQVSDFEIPLPSLEIQRQIIEKVKSEQHLIEANKKLINIYKQKMKDVIEKLWKK